MLSSHVKKGQFERQSRAVGEKAKCGRHLQCQEGSAAFSWRAGMGVYAEKDWGERMLVFLALAQIMWKVGVGKIQKRVSSRG